MSKYVFIKTADNSAYMNTAANFRGAIHSADTAVELFFTAAESTLAGAYDKITLVTASNKEQEVMDAIGGSLAGSHSKGMVVIADDVASKYVNANITSVNAFELATGGSYKTPIVTAIDRTLLAAESGSTVIVNHAAKVITMPTVALGLQAGMWFDVVPAIDPEAGFTVVAAEGMYGHLEVQSTTEANNITQQVLRSAAIAAPANFDNFDLVHDTNTLGGVAGQRYHFEFDGTAWNASNQITADHANPASTAIINAG
tara:strand:+ start:312 stop:1082 length:771 start_codon:yes stop_codon:yes gene_type:complete